MGTSITTKQLHFFLSAVYSPWKNLCIAQKQANASLLITGSSAVFKLDSAAAPETTSSCKSSLLEGSLGLRFLVYKYNEPSFLFSCGAQHLFTFGTMSHNERCKLFSAFFFLKKTKNAKKKRIS